MVSKRLNAKGRRESGAFAPIPCAVLSHANFIKLTMKATRLLFDLCSQLNFNAGGTANNGNLTAALSIMKHRGWKSPETLSKAVSELRYYGFIIQTRPPGRNICALYAIAWWSVDDCHPDVIQTKIPSNEWKHEKPKFKYKKSLIRFFDPINTKSVLAGNFRTGTCHD